MIRDNETVLSVQGITRSYGDLKALADLSFDVRAGEILGLLGPNGAGKTTAIRVLTTILPATAGRFEVMDIPGSEPLKIRALIGVLPESNGFPAFMTGEDYLTFTGRLYGRTRQQAASKAADLLRLFGLEDAARARISTYSRGMRQRLATARALINDPRVIFLDEPTLGFDPKGQREMLKVIQDAAEVNRVAVVLSSHLLEVVEAICHRVLILNRGEVIARGSIDEIKRQVAVPHNFVIRVEANATARALSVLSEMEGVSVTLHTNHVEELIVTARDTPADGHVNSVLQRLIQADIPIEACSRERVRLSDAFLSMIEAVKK